MVRRIGVLAMCCAAVVVRAAPVRLQLEPRGCTAPVVFTAEPVETTSATLTHPAHNVTATVAGPEPVTLELAPERRWRIMVSAPGCWSPQFEVTLRPAGEDLVVGLWPAGVVSGTVEPPKSDPTPSTIEASIRPVADSVVAGAVVPPSAVVLCPISEGKWACPAPAGRIDLRVAVRGYVPHYFWDVNVPVRGEIPAGRLTLTRGASVAGWVSVPSTRKEPTTVELRPETAGGSPPTAAKRLAARVLRAQANERGFFQFRPVDLGSYELIARHQGWSRGGVAPVVVKEPDEVLLPGTVRLDPLASLSVRLTPPFDPLGAPWELVLNQLAEGNRTLETLSQGKASDLGEWTVPTLESGTYLLLVRDNLQSTYTARRVELSGRPTTLEVDINSVPVEIRVTCGDAALTGRLTLWNSKGTKVKVDSDADGVFRGAAPGVGTWRATLELPDASGRLNLRSIEVTEAERTSGLARLELKLSGLGIAGKVMDEHGRGAVRAFVNIYDKHGGFTVQLRTNDQGRFSSCGLEAGDYVIQALTTDAASDEVPFTLTKGGKSDELEIALHPNNEIRLRLPAQGGGVPGVLVRYFDPSWRVQGRFTSDFGGHVKIPVPRGTPALDIVALCPGFPTILTKIALGEGNVRDFEIPMDVPAGTLDLFSASGHLSVAHGGAVMSLQFMVLPQLGIPREYDPSTGHFKLYVESGTYSVCAGSNGTPPCANGVVPPNGVLELEVGPGTSATAPPLTPRKPTA